MNCTVTKCYYNIIFIHIPCANWTCMLNLENDHLKLGSIAVCTVFKLIECIWHLLSCRNCNQDRNDNATWRNHDESKD